MNAEDCYLHRHLIDAEMPDGIYYPWTCPCPPPVGYCPECGCTAHLGFLDPAPQQGMYCDDWECAYVWPWEGTENVL